MTVENYENYRVDKSIRMLWFSKVTDQESRIVAFEANEGRFERSIRPGPPKHEGFDLTVSPLADKPCSVYYEFEREVTVYLGEQTMTVREITIPVNQVRDDPDQRVYKIEALEPGQRWQAPASEGCWSVDPRNEIHEKHEDDNLFIAKLTE